MLRRTFTFGGTLLVAAALVFLTPGSSQARGGFHGGGGGHGGGFHGGGFHSGGFHTGGFHGSYRPYYHNYGGYRPYYHNYGHYRSYGYYPYYYPYYSTYYPYSSTYYPYSDNYYPYSDTSDPADGSDLGSGSTYDPGPSGSAYQSSSSYTPSPAQGDTAAHLTVTVPADAELWFEGTKVTTSGSVREFTSPPLTPGKKFTYDVRARWQEGDREVTQKQEVGVAAGAQVRVEFPVPSRTVGQAVMPKAR